MATAFALRSLPVRRSTPRDNSCMLLQTSGMKTGQRGSRKPHRQLSQHAARAFSRSSAYAPFFDCSFALVGGLFELLMIPESHTCWLPKGRSEISRNETLAIFKPTLWC